MKSRNFSPLKFYKLIFYSYENKLNYILELLKQKEPEIRNKCIANKSNKDYDKLIIQSINKGYKDLFEMLKTLNVLNEKNINKYLEAAINGKHEDIAITIYNEREEICNIKEIKKPFQMLKEILKINFYTIFKLIYTDYVKDLNINNNQNYEELEEIINAISKKGELHLVSFIKDTTPNIFNELYTDIVINSIYNGYLDIFDYMAKELNIKEINNEDKLDLLKIALKTNNEDIFSIVYEIIEPVDLTKPNLNLIKQAKKQNKEIFAFLYTEADNQIRGYKK